MEIDPPSRSRTPAPEEGAIWQGAEGILSPLKRKTIAENPDPADLERRVGRLTTMPQYELVRENNIAKWKEVLHKMGLDKSFDENFGTSKKRKGGETSGGRRKKSKGGENEEEGSDEEEEGGDEEEEAPRPPPAPRPRREKQGPAEAMPKEWAVKAKATLESTELGASWIGLLAQWWEREKKFGFVAPVS